jgi:hypothetical protein
MRDPSKDQEIAAEEAPSMLCAQSRCYAERGEQIVPGRPEAAPRLPSGDLTRTAGSRSMWVYLPQGLVRRTVDEWPPWGALCPDKAGSFAHHCKNAATPKESSGGKDEKSSSGASLFQDSFFFCKISNPGEVPGTGCIYVETAVDRDSGIAFAKVYSTKNAMNAVDLLASRAVPFFKNRRLPIDEVHTRKTREYCGLPPAHPYETFLATSHIQHCYMNESTDPHNDLCERFYTVLLNRFFQPALRKKFQLSLDELQKDLDVFVEAYNAERVKRLERPEYTSPSV